MSGMPSVNSKIFDKNRAARFTGYPFRGLCWYHKSDRFSFSGVPAYTTIQSLPEPAYQNNVAKPTAARDR